MKQNSTGYTKTITLGGDHTITLHALRGFVQSNPGAGIIIFDAHADAVQNFHPLQNDLIVGIIKEKLILPDRIIIVGLRSWSGEEKDFLNSNGIRHLTMKKLTLEGLENVCDGVMETANPWPAMYISIDLDVADPVFAPGVGSPVAGGFTSRELVYFIQRLALLKNFKGADICECDIKKDPAGFTLLLAAKLAKELS